MEITDIQFRELRKIEEALKSQLMDNSIFLPNIKPKKKVDYIFIGTEPSLGGWATKGNEIESAKDLIRKGFKNFILSKEDFIMKYAVENFLRTQSYYITDISKIALKTDDNSSKNKNRKLGIDLLKKEIEIFGTERTKIISIGKGQVKFLKKCNIKVDFSIYHFSPLATRFRNARLEKNKLVVDKTKTKMISDSALFRFAEQHLIQHDIPKEIRLFILEKFSEKNENLSVHQQNLLKYFNLEFHEFKNIK